MDDIEENVELMVGIGELCEGHEMHVVIVALLDLIAGCAVQCNIPKQEFLAQAYESLSRLYDDMTENENGNSTHH
jgi:hypothetical protein